MRFEVSAIGLHIRFYLRSLRTFLGPGVPLSVSITVMRSEDVKSLLELSLLSPLRSEFEDVDCVFDNLRKSGRGYYLDLCFHIHATAPGGRRLELVDGGSVDWTRRLLSNAKERLIISGLGTERLCTEFETTFA